MVVMSQQENENRVTSIDVFRLWKLLDHTKFMVGRLREMELAAFGLTPEQVHVLDILFQNGGSTTINEIVDLTMRQHHSISTLINRMARQGLVNKIKTADDKRIFKVVITDKGLALLKKVSRDSIINTFDSLSDEEKTGLDAYLHKLLIKAYSLLGKEYKPHFPLK
jgi:MarR family transcriptional regulator, 2-MHQ and catechol-resistance regulon repressor